MQWISIKDKLPFPEENFPSKYMLVCCNDNEIRIGYFHKGKMHISCEYCSEDRYVTHWMELPSAPDKLDKRESGAS